jgi:ketosteroid isomerase-like protein
MKPTVLLLTLSSLAVSAPLLAQEWSSEEQEVIDTLAHCWDVWMEGVEAGSPDGWISECSTPTATYWGAPDGAPNGNDFIRRNWEMIRTHDLGWVDIRPLSINVEDGVAVLHFYGYWRAPSADGGEIVTEARRTEVFRRIDGSWKLIAGHGTPVTPADAAPYRRGEG